MLSVGRLASRIEAQATFRRASALVNYFFQVLMSSLPRKDLTHSQNGLVSSTSFGRCSQDRLVLRKKSSRRRPYRPAGCEAVISARSKESSAVAPLEDLQVSHKHGVIGRISRHWHRYDGRLVQDVCNLFTSDCLLKIANQCRPEYPVHPIHLWHTQVQLLRVPTATVPHHQWNRQVWSSLSVVIPLLWWPAPSGLGQCHWQ